jgi:hypothetical protein
MGNANERGLPRACRLPGAFAAGRIIDADLRAPSSSAA